MTAEGFVGLAAVLGTPQHRRGDATPAWCSVMCRNRLDVERLATRVDLLRLEELPVSFRDRVVEEGTPIVG